ncbi:MAG: hypothetical protein KKC19_04465 [Nanoarchaeota archaeon]|nr:hypothetical protein [Nanoarchaeota archaeon]
MEYDSVKKEIILNKSLNELDKFTLDFLKIIEKHTDYAIVFGYVSLLGVEEKWEWLKK